MNFSLFLPWPPALNHYYRSVTIHGRARVLISKDGRKYRETVSAYCMAQRAPRALAHRLCVRLHLNPPDRRRRDIDGTLKALLDALTKAGVWLDDSQIDELHLTRGAVKAGGAVTVQIEPMPEWAKAAA